MSTHKPDVCVSTPFQFCSVPVRFKTFSLFSYLQLLQQKLETSFYSGQFGWEEVNPNDAAALLKKFIRELPAPLLTPEYVNTFSAVRGRCDDTGYDSSRVDRFPL